MEKIFPNYSLAIYENGEVKRLFLTDDDPVDSKDIKFLIHREFLKPGKNTVYYKTKIFQQPNFVIQNNTFEYFGIRCTIHENDVWATSEYTWNYHSECLMVDIWDRLDQKKTICFSNSDFAIRAFTRIIRYINNLAIVYTHKGCELIDRIIYDNEIEIAKLKIAKK
jgi:hypothetical protein